MAPQRICSIPGCGKSGKLARGLCRAHYLRWYRHGDPLAGLPSPSSRASTGEPLKFYHDRVLTQANEGDCLEWPYSRSSSGYGTLWFDGQMVLVSRLVCEHVNGPAPTPEHEAAHSCGRGNLGCVSRYHLSWKTHAGNMADKIAHGTTNRGERNASAKLTESDVREIRRQRPSTPLRELSERFGVSVGRISSIASGKSWARTK